MSLDTWILYTIAALGLSLTPGPSVLLSLTHGMRFGVRQTLYTALGSSCGFTVLIGASMVGLGALLAASEQAFTIAKWCGAAYLIYLGIKTWRAPGSNLQQACDSATNSPAKLFWQGFLVAASNPKAVIFFAAFLPQFINPTASLVQQFVIFAATFVAIEFIYEICLAGAAQRIAPWLGRHGKLVNRTSGATFIGIGGLLSLANRP